MINIEKIEIYIPKKKINLKKKYKKIDKNFLKNKLGSTTLPRKDFDDSVISLCSNLRKKLILRNIRKNIKLLLLCTQNPDFSGLPHNSAVIHSMLKLPDDVAVLDISQGCAGYLYGLKVADSFLEKNQYALFYTCDPYSSIIKKNNYNTDILFGDAATVSLLKKTANKKKIGLHYSEFYSFGNEYNAIINLNNELKMDGSRVMKFCINKVPILISNFLKKYNLNFNDIDKFYLHQGSKHIVDIISKKLHLSTKQKVESIENIGNTVSSSIPILLKKRNFHKNKNIIICGFGVGLSVSIGLYKVR